jgi:hypothetical protein
MALRIRRGTSSQRLAITPASGELIFDTTQTKLYVGNGSTAGGVEVVAGSIGGNLGSNINLNNFNIGGTGNIDITGSITASGNIIANGDITLGNAATDNVSFGADINSNILPNTSSLTLGSTDKVWNTVYIQNLANTNASTAININSPLVLNQNTTISANVVPDQNGQRSLGSSNLVWSGVYSDQFKSAGLIISGDSIVATESNANITLTPSGTGVVATSRISASSHINVGTVNPLRIEEEINATGQSIHYFYDNGTGGGKVLDRVAVRQYTQLVTSAAEAISSDPIDGTVFAGGEFTTSVFTGTGSQIIKFLYLYSGGVGQVTTLSNTWVGTKPIDSVGLKAGSQFIVDLVTNTTATAGLVYNIKIKQTLFRNT